MQIRWMWLVPRKSF